MTYPPKYKAAVKELFYWQYDYDPRRFSCMLYDLMQKADAINILKIAKGFPVEYEAWMLWNASGNFGHDLFNAYGFHSCDLSEK